MPRYASLYRARKRKAFTLVELLTVVLILSILMSVAAPLYLNALDDSRKKVCRANLQTISNAVMAARVKNAVNDFGLLITGGVTITNLPDLSSLPRCPNGGAYALAFGSSRSNATFQVQCSATYPLTHGKYEPGVDNK
jgi:prepilin-type N-terminal cleavage/methylation domain-containing protein